MNSQTPSPTASFKTEAARKPEDGRGEDRPFIPITQSPIKGLTPTDRASKCRAREVHLGRKEKAQTARNDQDNAPPCQPPFAVRRSAHFCRPWSMCCLANDGHDCLRIASRQTRVLDR